MPWNTTTPILIWAVVTIPYFFLLWLFPPRVKLIAVIAWLGFAAVNLYFFLVANWVLINYWLRLLPLFMTILIGVRLFLSNRPRYVLRTDSIVSTPFWPEKKAGHILALLVSSLIVLASFYVNFRVLQSLSYRSSYTGRPVMLLYPMRYGLYVVTNGGNGLRGVGMNDAYQDYLGRPTRSSYMAYAVDMMKLENNRGSASDGVLPPRLQDYVTFMDQVYAPCEGEVVHVENNHPDKVMGTPEDPLGNRVVLSCYEYYVTIAGLRRESILVEEGDYVGYRVQLGAVGSSGDPSIPHLRVFTTLGSWGEDGTPVPQIFDLNHRFHVRNDLFLPSY